MSDQYPPQYPGQYPSQNQPPPPPPPYQPAYQPPQTGYMPQSPYPAAAGYAPIGVAPVGGNSKLAVASLILGIVGLCTGLASIGAVICGHMALNEIKKANYALQGRGMAIAGLVMGYLEIALIVAYIIVIVIAAASSAPPSY